MIRNRAALSAEALPEDLYNREQELQRLTRALRPVTRDEYADTVHISGPTGVGKTTIAKYLLTDLERETGAAHWGHVNCIRHSSERDILWELARQANRGRVPQTHGRTAGEAITQLEELDTRFVAVLDEAALADASTIYNLYELETTTMVLISVDDLDLSYSDIQDRVRSRLYGKVRIEMEPYTHGEMADILRARADRALYRNSYTDQAIDRMTEIASGNARLGITLLRLSAKHAHGERADEITAETVDEIEDDALEEVREMNLSTLGTHQHLLYQIIKEAGEISASDLHAEYERRIGDPKPRSTRRRYLKILRYYNLVEKHGQKKGTTYIAVRE